jgi:hypothetical protein
MEAYFPYQHRPIPWCFRVERKFTHLHHLSMDALWKLERIRDRPFGSQSYAAGAVIPTLIWSHELHSVFQLIDVCTGLQFLHSLNIVHGDLKGVSSGLV